MHRGTEKGVSEAGDFSTCQPLTVLAGGGGAEQEIDEETSTLGRERIARIRFFSKPDLS